ncbi:MAG: glycosyltransferase [Quadrisphaera sp.]
MARAARRQRQRPRVRPVRQLRPARRPPAGRPRARAPRGPARRRRRRAPAHHGPRGAPGLRPAARALRLLRADLLSLAAAEAGLPGPALRLLTALEAWVLRGAARVMTVDEGYAARVRALGVPAERVAVVGTGVDTDQLRPPDPSPGAGHDDGDDDDQPPAFVYAGTMSEVQGAGVLVDALARVLPEHPGARAVFYGGGVQAGELSERAARLAPGLIAFPGLVAPSEIARATATARAGLASQRPDTAYASRSSSSPSRPPRAGRPSSTPVPDRSRSSWGSTGWGGRSRGTSTRWPPPCARPSSVPRRPSRSGPGWWRGPASTTRCAPWRAEPPPPSRPPSPHPPRP